MQNWLREEKGLVFLEYVTFASFLLLMVIGIYIWLGPRLKTWVSDTYDCFTEQTTSANCANRTRTETGS